MDVRRKSRTSRARPRFSSHGRSRHSPRCRPARHRSRSMRFRRFADATRFRTSPAAVVNFIQIYAERRIAESVNSNSMPRPPPRSKPSTRSSWRQSPAVPPSVPRRLRGMLEIYPHHSSPTIFRTRRCPYGASIDDGIATFNKGSRSNLNSFGRCRGNRRAGGGLKGSTTAGARPLSGCDPHAEGSVRRLSRRSRR